MSTLLPILGFALLGLALAFTGVGLWIGDGLRFIVLASPWWLLAGLLPVAALLLRAALAPRPPTLRFSRMRSAQQLGPGFAARLAHLPDGLRLAAALLLVVAMARPQSSRLTDRSSPGGRTTASAWSPSARTPRRCRR